MWPVQDGALLVCLEYVGGIDSDKEVSCWDISEWPREEEVREETVEGWAVVDKERELAIHRLDTDVISI